MFILEKTFPFEAAHQLPNHDGKCARLHGHSWKLTVSVVSAKLNHSSSGNNPKAGMLMDYGDIKTIVKPFVDKYLDHYHLNDSTGLENPTSEELARWIYDKLKVKFVFSNIRLSAITIEETCTSKCIYMPLSTDELTAIINQNAEVKTDV